MGIPVEDDSKEMKLPREERLVKTLTFEGRFKSRTLLMVGVSGDFLFTYNWLLETIINI